MNLLAKNKKMPLFQNRKTIDKSFMFNPNYKCAIKNPSKKEKMVEYILAIAIGLIYAIILFVELSK